MKYPTILTRVMAVGTLLLSSTSFVLSPPSRMIDIGWDVDVNVPGDQNTAPGIAAAVLSGANRGSPVVQIPRN